MSMVTERAAIRVKLAAAWGSTTAIAWDGLNGPPYTRVDGTEFIRPRIEDGESSWAAISASVQRERKLGVVVVEVMTPSGTGDARGNALCDLLIGHFTRFTDPSGTVRFDRRGFAVDAGTDGTFHRWHVFLPYYREEAA